MVAALLQFDYGRVSCSKSFLKAGKSSVHVKPAFRTGPGAVSASRSTGTRRDPAGIQSPAARCQSQAAATPLRACSQLLYLLARAGHAGRGVYVAARGRPICLSPGFSVRTEEASSAIELLGGITDLSSGSSSDTDILNDFLTSQELVREIDQAVDLRAIWSRVPTSRDPVFAFDAPGTIEDLVDHWERKVTIIYDSGAGLIDMRVLAFDPQDARAISPVRCWKSRPR